MKPTKHLHLKMRFIYTVLFITLILFNHIGNAQTGHVLNGSGARSFGMAGVGTGYATNPSSALIWSPASITKMSSSIEINGSLISLQTKNYSELDLSILDPSLPQGSVLAGDLNDDTKSTFLPIFSYVYNPDSRWSFGLTAAGIGGFGVDYKSSTSSPISLLFGDVKSQYRLFQISLTAAYEINEKLSIGVTPTFNMASLELTPISTAAPSFVNGLLVYPTGDKTDALGYGFHVGLFYEPNEEYSFGMTYKSRQYFEDFVFDSQDRLGNAASTSLDYPMILSVGGAYKGLEDFVLSIEARIINFSSTSGLGSKGYAPDLAVRGFGWNDAYFLGFGIEYFLSEPFTIRGGYSYNTNPIVPEVSFFSSVATALIQHAASLGSTYSVNNLLDVTLGYHHGFKGNVEGPIIVPSSDGGQSIPSLNRSELATHVISLDVTIKL